MDENTTPPIDTPVSLPDNTQAPSDNLQNPIIEAPQVNQDQGGNPDSASLLPGEPLQGEVIEEKPKHPGGRPSKYNEGMLQTAKNYYLSCMKGETYVDKKGREVTRMKTPLLEELARLCDVHGETITEWEKENEEFSETVKKIRELQKERIIQRGFNATNPTFAIFMLKANHGMMETEKRVLAGEKNSEPVQFTVQDYKGASQPQITNAVQEAVIEEGSE